MIRAGGQPKAQVVVLDGERARGLLVHDELAVQPDAQGVVGAHAHADLAVSVRVDAPVEIRHGGVTPAGGSLRCLDDVGELDCPLIDRVFHRCGLGRLDGLPANEHAPLELEILLEVGARPSGLHALQVALGRPFHLDPLGVEGPDHVPRTPRLLQRKSRNAARDEEDQ